MRGKQAVVVFVLGAACGVGGTLAYPRFLAPYLPPGLGGPGTVVEGQVLRKQRDGDRLLLTVDTPRGRALVAFRQRASEVDLLVDEGDSLTLSLRRFTPFLEDPDLMGVKDGAPRPAVQEPAAPTVPASPLPQ